jgi:hypothetical protein
MAIIFLLVVGGVAQCFVLSYDALYGLSERSAVELPLLGRLNLLGEGAYIMPPNSDRTDRGYWVAPQILSAVRERAEGAASLGLLVNDTHLNADILRYQALLEFPEVEVRDLARDESGAAVYTEVFAADYVVYSTHDPFRKRVPPAEPEVEEYYQHLVGGLGPTLRDEDAIVVEPASEAGTFARFYSGSSTLYLLPTGDSAEDLLVLEEITNKHDRVHLVLRHEDEADPDHLVERWLTEHAYRARDEWYGDVRAILFASPTGEQTAPRSEEVAATLGGQISLQSVELLAETVEPGGILPVTLSWTALEEVAEDYVVFVHLLDEEGQVVAQHDGPPVGGFRATTTWIPGETVQDRHGVLIPQDAPPGEYGLAAGLYLCATGERLPAVDGNGQGIGDSVMLGRVLIVSSEISADGEQDG